MSIITEPLKEKQEEKYEQTKASLRSYITCLLDAGMSLDRALGYAHEYAVTLIRTYEQSGPDPKVLFMAAKLLKTVSEANGPEVRQICGKGSE
ncbi:MAG TPA: hypothetical protein VH593_15685 [Ktedonobacteraceae bacterium]|jgi:hypothetical protein